MYKYILPLLLLFMVGCATKIETDYDPVFETKELKTFSIVHKSQEGVETLNDERIREAITNEMQLKGYEVAAPNAADFHITFQTAIEEDVPSNFSFGFGVGTYSKGSGASVGTTRNVTNDKENLFINMVDPKTQKTFWRAAVSKKRRDFKSPQARSDHFNKTVASMLKDFPVRSTEKKSE
ncbi:MAG: DUF4136 domain-containing protein [Sulfurimonadaceae bacterium]